MYFIVTHLITSVENGCCPRTMKYLYAVAAAKWIVNFNCKFLCIVGLSLNPAYMLCILSQARVVGSKRWLRILPSVYMHFI